MRRAVAAVLIVVALAGCAVRGPRPLRPATAAELLDGLAARRAAVGSIRARARLRAGLAGAWVREAVLISRPESIRIDVLSPIGLAYALGTNGAVLWAYPPSERTRYEGPATAANVTRLFGVPIAVADVVDVLLGVPPARRPAGAPALTVTREGQYRLTLPLDDGTQDVWFAGDTLEVRRAEEVRRGRPTMHVAYDDYQNGFPHVITVTSPGNGRTIELDYGTVEPNLAIPAVLFQPPPADRVLPLEAAVAGRR